jgi:multidrug efflux pump subunit AcrB
MKGGKGVLADLIRHRVAANVLVLLALLGGFWGMTRMNVQFFPSFELDVVTVRVVWPGAFAEDVQASVVRPLEELLKNTDGLKRMSSTSAQGVGNITLELLKGTNPVLAQERIRQQVEAFRNLPAEAEKPEVVRVERYEPIARILVKGAALPELRPWVQRFERELLEGGIDRISVSGLPSERISVAISAATLQSLGLSLADVADRIARLSRNLPAGSVGQSEGARDLRALEQRENPHDFGALPVLVDEGGLLTLSDVAQIEREPRPGSVLLYEKGEPVVELLLQRAQNGHSIKAARGFSAWLEKTRPTLPPGIVLEVYDEQWSLIQERIELLLKNGLSGLLLVVAVLYFFLPARVALWVMLGIPTAFMGTLAVMWFLGGSINMMSLFALIMALGIIVDDAIVVSEDAHTHAEEGEGPIEAALGGARRMFFPVLAASLTTVAAFLPLMMVGGVIGNILGDIPFVMIAVILASLVESFLILPAHLKWAFEKAKAQASLPKPHISPLRERLDAGFVRFRDGAFRDLLEKSLRFRQVTIALTMALMLLAVGLLAGGRLQFVFFPSPEGQVVYVNAQFVAGTPKDETARFLAHLEARLLETETALGEPLIQRAVAYLGSTVGGGGAANARGDHLASMLVELSPPDVRETRNEAFLHAWEKAVGQAPGLELLTFAARRSGPPGRDLSIRLTGEGPVTLKAAALSLSQSLRNIEGVLSVEDDMPYGREQLIYRLTPAGHALGLSIESVSRQLRAAFEGALAQWVQVGRDELEVRVLLPENERERLSALSRLSFRLPNGEWVPLSSVLELSTRQGFETLRHADGRLAVEVSAEVDTHRNNADQIQAELARGLLPELVTRYALEYSFEGRSADQRETMSDMRNGLILGLFLIYLILVWSFSSWSWPLIVMSAIPLGLAGALFGHWVLGMDLTILSLFGLFGLAGIVVNNSIILVSLFQDLRRKGMALEEALIGAACGRLRAVLLTSLTTIGGLIPLLFEGSLQAQFLIPMAASIAFGLGFSALLILFFIPALLLQLESMRPNPVRSLA